MYEESSMTLVAAVLVVGLLVGAGVGYYMAPSGDGSNSYSSTRTYDEGYEIGYEEARERFERTSSSSSYVDEESLEYKVSGLTTLVYGAIGASLVAALAAIVSLMQISRRISG